jgi:hypothetical protein
VTTHNYALSLRFGTVALARAKATFLSVTLFCLRKKRADANASYRGSATRNVDKAVRYVQWLERCLRWILRSWCGEKRSWKQEREEGFRSVVRCGVRYCYALLYRIPHQYYFDDLRLESENWVVSKREFQS